MAQIVIPENLKPKDGRFGCGPSKMRPEQITSFVQFAQEHMGTSHRHDDFLLVTPGVRPASASLDDQTRVMTPNDAIQAGSSYLVVGRPITAAADPLAALRAIDAEIVA